MQGVVIRDGDSARWFNPVSNGKYKLVTSRKRAHIYDEYAAKNIIDFGLPKHYRKTARLEYVDDQTEQSWKQTPVLIQEANPVSSASILEDAQHKLVEQLTLCDRELSDVYHLIVCSRKQPAHKGYKLYAEMKTLLDRRAEIKLRIGAISDFMKRTPKPYRPRTALYRQLAEELDIHIEAKP